jgi:hypothetical protein
MTGGILQLVAKGPDDVFLNNEPEITFFKAVYRRHTNFTFFPMNLYFNKEMNFGTSGYTRIKNNGDLVFKLILIISLPEIKMKFPECTNIFIKSLLSSIGIDWNYEGEALDLFTLDDYAKLIIYVNNLISQYLLNINNSTNVLNIINSKYTEAKNNNYNGVHYSLNVFTSLIENKGKYILYEYLMAYYLDNYNLLEIFNFDEIKMFVYSKILEKITNPALSLPLYYAAKPSIYQPMYAEFPNLRENIIFYHVLSDGTYIINNTYIGKPIKDFFDQLLQNGYSNGSIISAFNYTINTILDASIIYNNYFNKISSYRPTITGTDSIYLTKTELLNDIEWNIRKNIQQINNICNILFRNEPDKEGQYTITIFKRFRYISAESYNGTEQINLLNNTTNIKLKDNFSTALKIPKAPTEPTSITHYFMNDINTNIKTFNTELLNIFRESIYGDYFENYIIWERLSMTKIDEDYDLGPSGPPSQYTTLNNILLMDLIPLYIVDDIPKMVSQYLIASGQLTEYEPNFNLVKSDFSKQLNADLRNYYYNTFDLAGTELDTKNRLSDIQSLYLQGNNNKLLIALLKPEYLYTIDTTPYSLAVENNKSYSKLLPIDYVIESYTLKYTQMIREFTGDELLSSNLIKLIINNVVNKFRTPKENIPSYQAYANNNYTLFNIEEINVINTIVTKPEYLDAASSIWYNIRVDMITAFNRLYNNILLSSSYYTKSLGSLMTDALDRFKLFLNYNNYTYSSNFDYYRLRISSSSPNNFTELSKLYNYLYSDFNKSYSEYSNNKTLLYIKNYITDRPIIYFTSFDYIFTKIKNEILNNRAIYYPNTTISNMNTFLSVIESDLNKNSSTSGIRNVYGVIDTKYKLREEVYIIYINAQTNNNFFAANSYRHKWFDKYSNLIDTQLMVDYDNISNIINNTNTSKQYNDPYMSSLYNFLNYESDLALYYALTIILDSEYKKLVSEINDNLEITYNNFKTEYTNIITDNQTQLEKIAIENPKNSNNWTFIGTETERKINKFLTVKTPSFAWAKYIGQYLIEKITFDIGGQIIESHDSQWLRYFSQLFGLEDTHPQYKTMVGNIPELYTYDGKNKRAMKLYVPLHFPMCNYDAEALPLVAMRFTTANINIKMRTLDEVAKWDKDGIFIRPPKIDCKLLAHYIYVEPEERNNLVNKKLDYLYNYVEKHDTIILGSRDIINNITKKQLYFNNSSKFILIRLSIVKRKDVEISNFDWSNTKEYIEVNNQDKEVSVCESIKFLFDGIDREVHKESSYYTYAVPYVRNLGSITKNIYIYSFSLEPKKLQPSGSCNFGMINTTEIELKFSKEVSDYINSGNGLIKMELYNYGTNILRYVSGLCGPIFYS